MIIITWESTYDLDVDWHTRLLDVRNHNRINDDRVYIQLTWIHLIRSSK